MPMTSDHGGTSSVGHGIPPGPVRNLVGTGEELTQGPGGVKVLTTRVEESNTPPGGRTRKRGGRSLPFSDFGGRNESGRQSSSPACFLPHSSRSSLFSRPCAASSASSRGLLRASSLSMFWFSLAISLMFSWQAGSPAIELEGLIDGLIVGVDAFS